MNYLAPLFIILAILLFLIVGILDFGIFGIHSDTPHLLGLTGFALASFAAAFLFWPWPARAR